MNMKLIKNICIPCAFLFIYFSLAYVYMLFSDNTVCVTVLSDVTVALFGFLYYNKVFRKKTDSKLTVTMFQLLFLLLCLVFMSCTWTSVWYYAMFGDNQLDVVNETFNSMIQEHFGIYLLLTCLIAPFTEEILMRGILLGHLKKIAPVGISAVLTGIVFAGIHGTSIHMYVGTLFGVFLAYVYEITGKLRYCVLCHMFYNFATIILSGFAISGVVTTTWFIVVYDVFVIGFLCYLYHKMCKKNGNLFV